MTASQSVKNPVLPYEASWLFHIKIYIIILNFIEIFIFVNYLVVKVSLRGEGL
jgi:hypothetical protein